MVTRSMKLSKISAVVIFNIVTISLAIGLPMPVKAWKFVDFGDVQTGINDFKQNVFAINTKVPAGVRSFITMTGDVTTDGATSSWANFKTAAAPLNIDWSVNNPFQFFQL